jgi:biotin transport system substrate-specific component
VAFPLPFSPVPITLQTLFVILAGVLLGPVYGPISQLLYLAAGVAGLPVFAGGVAGPGVLVGPTGGYLVGFVLGSWTAGLFTRPGSGWVRLVTGLLAAHAAIFVVGMAHLSVFVGSSLETAFRLGVVPFLPGMMFKTAVAAAAVRTRRLGGLFRP